MTDLELFCIDTLQIIVLKKEKAFDLKNLYYFNSLVFVIFMFY